MRTGPLECALWIGALAATLGARFKLDPDMEKMAAILMGYFPPDAKA